MFGYEVSFKIRPLATISIEYVDFWAKIYLIFYPYLGNSTTHITVPDQCQFLQKFGRMEDQEVS